MFNVDVTDDAWQDVREAYRWWRDHRSAIEAGRWYDEIVPAMYSLAELADTCPFAPEADLHPNGLREFYFGIGSRPTHRIIYYIDGSVVVLLRVLHTARQPLRSIDVP